MIRVRFVDVGPRRLTWEAQMTNLTESNLYYAVRRKKALGSKGIEFMADDETGMTGQIVVGMGRPVGRYELI